MHSTNLFKVLMMIMVMMLLRKKTTTTELMMENQWIWTSAMFR